MTSKHGSPDFNTWSVFFLTADKGTCSYSHKVTALVLLLWVDWFYSISNGVTITMSCQQGENMEVSNWFISSSLKKCYFFSMQPQVQLQVDFWLQASRLPRSVILKPGILPSNPALLNSGRWVWEDSCTLILCSLVAHSFCRETVW